MSKLDERQLALHSALVEMNETARGNRASDRRVAPCKSEMVDAVVRAVGNEGAETAEVYGELVDLAVVIELGRTPIGLGDEVLTLVRQFQLDCIGLVVAELERARY